MADELEKIEIAAVDKIAPLNGSIQVQLERSAVQPTDDQPFWTVIRSRTQALAFEQYGTFIDQVINGEGQDVTPRNVSRVPSVDAYYVLKTATESFLMQECGLMVPKEDGHRKSEKHDEKTAIPELKTKYLKEVTNTSTEKALPYMKRIVACLGKLPTKKTNEVSPLSYGILRSRVMEPCLIELIWSYWLEEAMLAQTMSAILLRFQNLRAIGPHDPLAMLELDPLRGLGGLLWGYIEDEQHRLSVVRRAYEYDHEYGLRLIGRAIPEMRPADSRSRFLEAWHPLLQLCSVFFKEDDDTTVIADGFPLLNQLRQVHIVLAEGAHNQFGELPWVARVEMLMQQWLLARPEMRDFLRGRIMVPYPEPWMDTVDTMRNLQGWGDASVRDFRDLANFGEQLLLSIRYGNWSEVTDRDSAANWARAWRSEIQGYIHSYRAVTGADLTKTPVDTTPPAVHLRARERARLRSL